jgi:hypothetical protein
LASPANKPVVGFGKGQNARPERVSAILSQKQTLASNLL